MLQQSPKCSYEPTQVASACLCKSLEKSRHFTVSCKLNSIQTTRGYRMHEKNNVFVYLEVIRVNELCNDRNESKHTQTGSVGTMF